MGHYDNLLTAKQETIHSQRTVIGVFSVLLVLMAVAVLWLSKHIDVHIPPDLSKGVRLGMNEIPAPNVYTFGFYIFQQLNHWPVNGQDDYRKRIENLKNYLTPACYQNRLDDYEKKKQDKELKRRERSVSEIPGRGYHLNRVEKESDSTWRVSIDVQLRETMLGQRVKTRLANYPLRIVRYAVDYELNPFQLALDCFAGAPKAIPVEPDTPKPARSLGKRDKILDIGT